MGYYSQREWDKVRARMKKAEEERERLASIATCTTCGAICRKDNGHWYHIGPCNEK